MTRAIDERAVDDQASYITKAIVELEQNNMKAAASEQGYSREKKIANIRPKPK
jgi:hypothetical protein